MHLFSTMTGIEDDDGEIYAMRVAPNGHVMLTIEDDFIHQHYMNVQLSIINTIVREHDYVKLVVYNDTLIVEMCVQEDIEFDVDYHEFNFNQFVKEAIAHIPRFEIEHEYHGMQECEIFAVDSDREVKVFLGESQGNDTFIRKQPYYSKAIITAISNFYDEQPMTYEMKDESTILIRHAPRMSIGQDVILHLAVSIAEFLK